jgi:hypothetical protein
MSPADERLLAQKIILHTAKKNGGCILARTQGTKEKEGAVTFNYWCDFRYCQQEAVTELERLEPANQYIFTVLAKKILIKKNLTILQLECHPTGRYGTAKSFKRRARLRRPIRKVGDRAVFCSLRLGSADGRDQHICPALKAFAQGALDILDVRNSIPDIRSGPDCEVEWK